ATFYPPEEESKQGGRLEVKVKRTGPIVGLPPKVELDLRPERIPGLIVTQKGRYSGYLPEKGELVLVARDLRFDGKESTRGLVCLTIDGCQRSISLDT